MSANGRNEVRAGPAQVGAELRAARERLGWEVASVATWLRIRPGYIEALEDGGLDRLPAGAYALGYLRAYAASLGLDAEELVRRFKGCVEQASRKPKLDFPVPAPERGIPAGALLLVAAVLAVGAYVTWYRLSGEGRLPAEVVQPVPKRLAPLAEQAIPPPPAPAPAPNPVAPLAQTAASVTTEPSPDLPTVPPSSAAAAMPVPLPPAAETSQSGAGAGAQDGRMVIRAKADSWVQVREKGGQPLLNRVLKAGETWPVPARSNLLLTTGNAGGTELLVDGVLAPGFGGPGTVRRDLPLDPDQIKEGRLPAQVQAASAQPSSPAQPAAQRTAPSQ